jgi:hypothetical protein
VRGRLRGLRSAMKDDSRPRGEMEKKQQCRGRGGLCDETASIHFWRSQWGRRLGLGALFSALARWPGKRDRHRCLVVMKTDADALRRNAVA